MNTQLVNLSMSESNSLSTYIDLNTGTAPKFPIFNDSSENLESVFGYDFIGFDQTATSRPWSHEGGLQTSDIDPSLVLFQNSAFCGTIPSTFSPTLLSTRTFGSFADSSKGSESLHFRLRLQFTSCRNSESEWFEKATNQKEEGTTTTRLKGGETASLPREKPESCSQVPRKNRQIWDRLHDQCLDLEAQNAVLKEKLHELEAEVERLSKLVREHRECGDEEIRKWVGRYGVDEISSELGRENDVMAPVFQSPSMSQEESSGFLPEDKMEEEHDIEADVDSGVSSNASKSTVAPLPADIEFDISSFIADENDVPSLSSSRKTSATSTEVEFDFILPGDIPSPADLFTPRSHSTSNALITSKGK